MKVYNTLTGEKQDFAPQGDAVKMYVCGVTPYSESHIGHAMNFVIFDVVRRYLIYRGFRVLFVQNITDIDDKIIERAAKFNISTSELTARYIKDFFEVLRALNVLPADVNPRATEEVPKIIEVIQGLVANGSAYPAGGSVYFRVRSCPDYGKLSHRTLEAMMSAEGGIGADEKESPLDFALWKATKPGEPFWESPWGPGRPGWHIECSAMSLKYLGNTLDIHGGGQDLIFPHHENEIAQSECYTGVKPFARFWMHNGLVQIGDQKMSKSLGNLVTIKDALAKYSADAIRIFILSSHYRSPLTYSTEALAAAVRGAERLAEAATTTSRGTPSGSHIGVEEYHQRFVQAMDDDFGTPQAIAAMFDLARDINRVRTEGGDVAPAQALLAELAGVLGLTLKRPEREEAGDAKPFIELLVTTRSDLRRAKQWQLADEIRRKLEELGIILKDTPEGTVWESRR